MANPQPQIPQQRIRPPDTTHLLFFMESQTWLEKIRKGEWSLNKKDRQVANKDPVSDEEPKPEEEEEEDSDENMEDMEEKPAKRKGPPSKRTVQDELYWFGTEVADLEKESNRMIRESKNRIPSQFPRPTSEEMKRELHRHVDQGVLKEQISKRVQKGGAMIEIAPEVDAIMSLALQNRMRHLLEKLVFQSKKRQDLARRLPNVNVINDMGTYLANCRTRAQEVQQAADSKEERLKQERQVLEAKKTFEPLTLEDMNRRRRIERELAQEVSKIKAKSEDDLALSMIGDDLGNFDLDLSKIAKETTTVDAAQVEMELDELSGELTLADCIGVLESEQGRYRNNILYKLLARQIH